MSYKHVRGGEVWFDDNPEGAEPTLESRAHAYACAKVGGDWRTIENARGSLLGCITPDAIVALVDRAADLDRLLAIIAHGDPLEIATAALCIGGRT
jgi:hypothetical protein